MSNQPPIAVYKADDTEITLPNNKVILDLSESFDPMPQGLITKYQHELISGTPIQILDNKKAIATAKFTEPGIYEFKGTVTDRAKLSGSATLQITVKPRVPDVVTMFGYKAVGISVDDQIDLIKNVFGAKSIRQAVELIDYRGERISAIDKAVTAGLKSILNINWESAGQVRKYPRDLVKYGDQLRRMLDVYRPEIAICENEPTTDAFYDDDIEYYLDELETFATICNEYGVQCADGCIFVEWVTAIMNGQKLRPNGQDNKTILEALPHIPTTYVNFHFVVKGNDIPAIVASAKYARDLTGKHIISNEHHYEFSNPDTVARTIEQVKLAELAHCIAWGGGNGSEAQALNNGLSLTTMGIAYRDAIKPLQ